MLEVNQSLEGIICNNDMLNRKRVSAVPQCMIAPAAKRIFVSGNIDTHSDLTEASESHNSMHSLLPILANSPPPSRSGIMGNEVRHMSDSSSDESDDSTSTVDSGVETDVGKTPTKPPKFLKPTLSVVHLKRSDSTRTDERPLQEDGFVRRMANLNARARVSVMLQRGKYNKKNKLSPSIAETVQDTAKRNSVTVSSAHFDTQMYAIPWSETTDSTISTETIGNIDSQPEDVTYNNLGLLYDGRTVHPHLRILLEDGNIPSRIIPLIVPAALSYVYSHVMQTVNQETITRFSAVSKARRGDNGWSHYGEPIKVVQYHDENNKLRTRKYYIGVKRKEEIIFVRNCICAKSGTQKPFVGKVASIWQENGGIMMTLFWYYRGDEIQDLGSNFVEGELLASQHYDENTVACIEDKCYVLGLPEYCRYKAAQKRQEDSLSLPNTSISVPNCHERGAVSVHQHWLPKTDTDPALVFLCYQGYNHFTGKVFRPS